MWNAGTTGAVVHENMARSSESAIAKSASAELMRGRRWGRYCTVFCTFSDGELLNGFVLDSVDPHVPATSHWIRQKQVQPRRSYAKPTARSAMSLGSVLGVRVTGKVRIGDERPQGGLIGIIGLPRPSMEMAKVESRCWGVEVTVWHRRSRHFLQTTVIHGRPPLFRPVHCTCDSFASLSNTSVIIHKSQAMSLKIHLAVLPPNERRISTETRHRNFPSRRSSPHHPLTGQSECCTDRPFLARSGNIKIRSTSTSLHCVLNRVDDCRSPSLSKCTDKISRSID